MESVLSSVPNKKHTLEFDDPGLLSALERATPEELDAANFGIVAMAPDTTVLHYNHYETGVSGYSSDRVLGHPFFSSIAPCMNRPLVGHRYRQFERLDEFVDFVFTIRVRPTRVRLRLLKSPEARRQYLLVRKLS